MALANATSKIRLFINEEDYSDYLVEGSISDDSAYSTNIITSKGSVKLAGDTSILDYNKTLFPIGSRVTIYSTLDNGNLAKLPRGHLYVLNSSIDVNERSTTLELGCSLAYLSEREGVFTDEVEDLIRTFISSSTLGAFVIEDYNLSTLQTLLEIDGRVIFQDRWGNIQYVDQFGSDGLGSNIADAKLTSFDKTSAISIESIGGAIEDIPSTIRVETNVETPTSKNDDDEDDPTPPPYITSETTRLIKRPDIEAPENNYEPINDPDTGDAETEVVAGCGTISSPGATDVTPYAYTIKAQVTAIEKEIQEKVINGRYVSYDATGNQVDWEYDFEYCSAMTYAGDVIRGVVDKYVEIANSEIEKAKALLSKANQNWTVRDDYVGRQLVFVNGVLNAASQQIINAIEYYNCAAQQYYDAADEISDWGAKNLVKDAAEWADKFLDEYGFSSLNQTFNTYGKGGELVQKVQYKYIHRASTNEVKNALASLGEFYRLSANLNGFRYKIIGDIAFKEFEDILNVSRFSSVVSGDPLPTQHDELIFRDPTRYLNLRLASKTVTTYKYGSVYTTETEVYTDYENPSNNYKRTSYSSSGSKNAIEEDRIETQRDGNGCIFVNEDASDTESKELAVDVQVTTTSPLGTPVIPVSWLGSPRATVKTVQMPLDFAPIRTKVCGGVKTIPDLAGTMYLYETIVQRYANNLAKKILADNFGYRITERGNRAELFEYYPFYPIALNLTSLLKGYKLRAASSNWVFDSNNVLCSFDCFNVGNIETLVADEVEPDTYVAFSKTESTTTLNNTYFNLPETGDSIVVKVVPTGGTLAVSGTPISANDTINAADITANNVTFTPSGSGTTTITTFFEVLDSSTNKITSASGIYPPLQITYVESPYADGGEFTNNTTNGGYDSDAGDFDTGLRPGGNISLNAGDFDTGATVVALEPAAPSGASVTNGDTDAELELGVSVLDAADTIISSDTLATPKGNVSPQYEAIIEFALIPSVFLNVSAELVPQLGWDYNYIRVPLGTDIDLGTIVDPNTYAMNFGTILSPNTPTLASSVV